MPVKAPPLAEAAADAEAEAAAAAGAGADAATEGAVVGAADAGLLAAGDDVVELQAAKTTDKDAANTAPLIDHLFGVCDMLPVSSSGLRARTACLPVRAVWSLPRPVRTQRSGAGRSEA